ncbi:MAG: SIR2 family protein [Chloroflexi bacterium]|nr:SIR2 family protein [Chloroflexota bacterium]MCL5273238.1 SIR2 family protein [Chloroflexota bacterium]
MRSFKRNEIVLLLGAGASVEAGVPYSGQMVQEVEGLVTGNDREWAHFLNLYNFVRSAIYYSEGIHGRFNPGYNIERLVNTLDELRKKDEHTLFPFVGSWNPKLVEVAGNNFIHATELRNSIVQRLRQAWLPLKHGKDAEYFSRLLDFQHQFEHPLRVFTLNYDLCVETACGDNNVERGFDEMHLWDWRRFDDTPATDKPIFLYKLHGSNDWYRQSNGSLTYTDACQSISDSAAAIIFGDAYKLQYIDPFLFFAYEFRRWTLEANVIVVIGYSFGDQHINGIISQALHANTQRLLLSVSPTESTRLDDIASTLDLKDKCQLRSMDCGAKNFLSSQLSINYLASLFPDTSDTMF